MTTSSVLVKVLIIYLGISVLLYAGGVRFTDAITGNTFPVLVNSSNDSASITDPNVQYDLGTVKTATPNVNEQTGIVSTGITFIDVLRAARDFVLLMINIILAIPALFFYLPPIVQLFVGVPLGFLGTIGLIYFVRTGS